MNKPGRNEPCYCGSGKKYKKCCIDKMEKSIMSKISGNNLAVEEQWEEENKSTASHLGKSDYNESDNDEPDNDESDNDDDNLKEDEEYEEELYNETEQVAEKESIINKEYLVISAS